MNRKSALAAVLAATLAATMSVTATAAESGGQYSEEQKYVEERLNNLTLGPSAGIFTYPPAGSSDSGASTVKPSGFTDQDLAAYADKVFELVNKERENAGAAPLERSGYLDEAANTRAMDCASVNSIRVDGQAHTRPDGSRWFTVLGIDENRNYGENTGEGRVTADAQMKSWMDSQGHRTNILYDRYTEIGIGCAVSEQGEIFAVQIFYRP